MNPVGHGRAELQQRRPTPPMLHARLFFEARVEHFRRVENHEPQNAVRKCCRSVQGIKRSRAEAR